MNIFTRCINPTKSPITHYKLYITAIYGILGAVRKIKDNSPDINYKAKFLNLETSNRSQRNVGGNNKVLPTKATN
jgi:hypothetical protein